MAIKSKYLVEFNCYHCGRPVKIFVVGRSSIKKAYCDTKKCVNNHCKIVRSPRQAKEYAKYLRKIQDSVPKFGVIEAQKIFLVKSNQLFQGRDCLGEIVVENENYYLVQRSYGGAKRMVRKDQCIIWAG